MHLYSCLSQVVDVLSIGLSGFFRIESLIAMKQAHARQHLFFFFFFNIN